MFVECFYGLVGSFFLVVLLHLYLRKRSGSKCDVAFFHPYCNSGGGGERVLWHIIKAIEDSKSLKLKCVVYTGDTDATAGQILERVKSRFNITLKSDVKFVFLSKRNWVEAKRYPRFTLLGQSIGSMVLAFEALWKFTPWLFFDTTGYAFTFPVASFFGCKVATYTHYPTISTDMLQQVKERRTAHNNDDVVAKSATISLLKLVYYKWFAFLYGFNGRFASNVLVNSTWTYNHINSLWKLPTKTSIVYPPCDTTEFMTADLTNRRENLVISIGQFRPEKDHALQIRAFHKFVTSTNVGMNLYKKSARGIHLVLIGGARGAEDNERVGKLRKLTKELGIQDVVQFRVNLPFPELKKYLSRALCGLHTMWNEHFGIGIVEFMASGVVTIAHNSGGPKMDIVVQSDEGKETGFLASTEDEYACALAKVFQDEDQCRDLRQHAREQCLKFSAEKFEERVTQELIKCVEDQ